MLPALVVEYSTANIVQFSAKQVACISVVLVIGDFIWPVYSGADKMA